MKNQTYAEATKNSPPNKLLRQALEFLSESNKALDIGSGSLRDSLFLKSKGFRELTAIDKEIPKANAEKVNFMHGKIEEFDFPQKEYDIVVAINSLPFLNTKTFESTFPKIIDSLKNSGVLCFTLFGNKDGWNSESKKESMNFHSKSEVLDLLKDFSDIKIFIEEEREGKTINGQEKHWHIFRVVVVK